ncbi:MULTISPECIES: YHYH protein [Streptomyces]|uniref:YHYH protein n=1 Tax=Streptomyces mirabilis TaxID=68239 RepID=A0ABU3UII5_9ACTN|nr:MULTISPECIES: YHYH protein [Streptomyces]MCX4612591.1 YHYH protein [Streptomyces mirabilis]MCX5352814.1 YHYH protein [Streptomyces mirabilis]MDU8993704.1 YHYH protein [Streptomyces mirabilis]QDN90894.1 YHYH protein [Streptomyces sp. RLB3-6]QDO11723.1 YHYH protein [Streptomyces sp. S1D4-23]
MYGVLGSVAVAAGAACALLGPSTAPADFGSVIDVLKRPFVSGTMHWHKYLKVTTTATKRRFRGNGLPDHPTGRFPVRKGTRAYKYYAEIPAHGYPNAAAIPIEPWNLDVTVPRDPSVRAQPTYDTQYHYHGPSQTCFGSKPSRGSASTRSRSRHSPLVGYAIDGFGIFGPRGEDGRIVRNRDLDVCHGHTHAIMWDGKKVVMYHYHLNGEYPYSLGCFRGEPVTVPGSGHGGH